MSQFAEQDVVLLLRTLVRIAEALERVLPPLIPPTETTKSRASVEAVETQDGERGRAGPSPPKVPPPAADKSYYDHGQWFWDGDCHDCPKVRSCQNYIDESDEQCIGWRTHNYKRGGK